QNLQGCLAAFPFGLGTKQVFLGHHFENGADVLGHAAVNEHEALLQFMANLVGSFFARENVMLRQETPATDAEFEIAWFGANDSDQFHAGPDAAGILPTAARAADPLPQNRARGHEAAFVLQQWTGERFGLASGAHANGNQ